jgi:hypothetical protein
MAVTVQRDEVAEIAAQSGWQHRDADRVDYYTRKPERVRVVWQGGEAISGGVLYRDGILMTLTRELDTVKGWLKR